MVGEFDSGLIKISNKNNAIIKDVEKEIIIYYFFKAMHKLFDTLIKEKNIEDYNNKIYRLHYRMTYTSSMLFSICEFNTLLQKKFENDFRIGPYGIINISLHEMTQVLKIANIDEYIKVKKLVLPDDATANKIINFIIELLAIHPGYIVRKDLNVVLDAINLIPYVKYADKIRLIYERPYYPIKFDDKAVKKSLDDDDKTKIFVQKMESLQDKGDMIRY